MSDRDVTNEQKEAANQSSTSASGEGQTAQPACGPSTQPPTSERSQNPRNSLNYNRAYRFMHDWLVARNPKYIDHKLTVRMRRTRLAELLCEYFEAERADRRTP